MQMKRAKKHSYISLSRSFNDGANLEDEESDEMGLVSALDLEEEIQKSLYYS